MKRLLIVDDEVNIGKVLELVFRQDGYEVLALPDGRDAIDLLAKDSDWDCIISDLRMQERSGMDVLEYIREQHLDIPFVLITAYGSIPEAVQAIKSGAADFISKPFDKNVLRHLVHSLIEERDQKRYRQQAGPLTMASFADGVVCVSPAMRDVVQKLRKLAKMPLTVCLTGESGVGKDRVARALHYYASQQLKDPELPFVSVNCPAIPDALLESELFGYKKGAFTGASQDYSGKVARAGSGILFLDEIGDMPALLQAKLLRLLEDGFFEPLGSSRAYHSAARFVCATNVDLKRRVEEKSFREDLYYRISTVKLHIPPLRERVEDIPVLASCFVQDFCSRYQLPVRPIRPDTLELLQTYLWPGNVRELKNAVLSAVSLAEGSELVPEDFSEHIQVCSEVDLASGGLSDEVRGYEARQLRLVLSSCAGNISMAARKLGLSRGALRYKIEKYAIDLSATEL